ncbi:MAG: HU family DNA-binding protein [Clostridia bacterium]|nr:HU family DNA-binding protein [Clostridia bacterium]
MTKTELIASVAEKTSLSKKDAANAVAAVFSTIQDGLEKGDKIALLGFGTFLVRERAARTGRNPRNGEPMQIAASKIPSFKAGKALKKAVNPPPPAPAKKGGRKKKA